MSLHVSPQLEQPLIQLAGVEKTFGHEGMPVVALRGVDLEITRGEFVAMLGDLSRSEATALVKGGAVTVGGAVTTKPSLRVAEGDLVAAEIERQEHILEPDPSIDVPVVHVDDDVIVVDKPAGLVVHPGAGLREGTIVNGLLARFPDMAGVGGDPDRPGVVHRLDKGTSGVMMFARTEEAHADLTGQLAARTVERRYLTLA